MSLSKLSNFQTKLTDLFLSSGSSSRKRDHDNRTTSPPQDCGPAAIRGQFNGGESKIKNDN